MKPLFLAAVLIIGLVGGSRLSWAMDKRSTFSDQDLLAMATQHFAASCQAPPLSDESLDHLAKAWDHLDFLRRRGVHNPILYLNQGNTALLMNKLPEAILAYRRGLRLAPNHAELRANLDFARSLVHYPPPGDQGRPPSDSWPPWLPRPTTGMLVTLAWLAYAASCGAATRWLMTRRQGWLNGAMLLGIGAILLGLFWLGQSQEDRWAARHPLVVIADDAVPLQRGNSASYPRHADLPLLFRGMEAWLLAQRGDWLQIQFASGAIGWVHRAQVLIDEP